MPAYHITGPSGSGKSTVGRVLEKRGFRVIETDFEPGLTGWVHNKTKEKITETPPQPFPEEWVAAHGWYWNATRLDEILAEIGDESVFFVGGGHNEKEFYHLFEKRFGLFVDSDTLVKRLQPREPERWLDGSVELKNLLDWNTRSKDFNKAHGAITIDSSQDPEVIADFILSHVRKKTTQPRTQTKSFE
jgi:shikimate kinase